MTYTVVPHRVTGDPYLTGDVLQALDEFEGTVTASVTNGEFTVRGWGPAVPTTVGPDTEAISRDLDEAARLVLGELIQNVLYDKD